MRRCCTFPLTTQAAAGFRRCSSAWLDWDQQPDGRRGRGGHLLPLSQRLVNQVVLTIALLFLGGYRAVGSGYLLPMMRKCLALRIYIPD